MSVEFTAVPVSPNSVPGVTSATTTPTSPKTTESKTETPQEAPKAPERDLYSEKAAALLRKEKMAYREKQEAKALRQQVEQEKAAIAQREQKIKEFESLKQTNPLKALELLGLDYNALTQIYLNNGQITPEVQIKHVESKLEEIQRKQAEDEQRRLEQEKIAAEQEALEVLNDFKSEIGNFLSAKKDTYEFINLFEQNNLVYDTIQEYFNRHQKILSIKEASDMVEKYLEGQLQRSTATNKFKKLLGDNKQTSPSKETTQPKQNTQQPRTLTNNMTSSAASFLPAKTEQDRISRALAALDKK